MAAFMELKGVGLVEKDQNGDVLWSWSYPSMSSQEREYAQRKAGLENKHPDSVNYIFCQWRQVWYYILRADFNGCNDIASLTQVRVFRLAHYHGNFCWEYYKSVFLNKYKITEVALVLMARDFNPEKYETLCQIFLHRYRLTGNPVSVLEGYLSVVTRGTCPNDENGKFSSGDYDKRQSYAKCCLKEMIQTFGVEIIFIYTAMLLKKRILVYCPQHSLGQLLSYTRSIPAFAWHRQNWNIVFPFVHLSEPEVEDLITASHFVAGVTESSAEGRLELYDLFVNIPNSKISITPSAKENFAMGKLHKDIAVMMMQLAEGEATDQDIVKEVASKTKELLNNLMTLATPGQDGKLALSLETLRARKMPPATENFLFSLAASEGFVQL